MRFARFLSNGFGLVGPVGVVGGCEFVVGGCGFVVGGCEFVVGIGCVCERERDHALSSSTLKFYDSAGLVGPAWERSVF